jgi:hypothetical protein
MARISGEKHNPILLGFTDAYVWIAVNAVSAEQFQRYVNVELQNLNLRAVALEEIRTAEEVESSDDPSHELLTLISRARREGDCLIMGSFYRFMRIAD